MVPNTQKTCDKSRDSLDSFYKIVKIAGVSVAILSVLFAAVAGVAVANWRIDSLQNLQTESTKQIMDVQVEARSDRLAIRKEVNDLDRSLISIQTDVKWMRQAMEKKQ